MSLRNISSHGQLLGLFFLFFIIVSIHNRELKKVLQFFKSTYNKLEYHFSQLNGVFITQVSYLVTFLNS